jgi:hypothetical protein
MLSNVAVSSAPFCKKVCIMCFRNKSNYEFGDANEIPVYAKCKNGKTLAIIRY